MAGIGLASEQIEFIEFKFFLVLLLKFLVETVNDGDIHGLH